MKSTEELIALMKKIIANEMRISEDEIHASHSFFELGLDSITSIFMMEKLEQELKVNLNPMYFWDYPTLETYAGYLANDVIKPA